MDLMDFFYPIGAWIVAGVLLYYRRKSLGKIAFMRSVETSRAADVSSMAPGTLVEVKGTLRCENPLKSEFAEQSCAYYASQVIREYEVDERDSDGNWETQRESEVMASNERFAPFVVEDESGAVGVRGEGAEVDALEVMNRFEQDTGEAGSITLGGLITNLVGGSRTIGYRYEEEVLPVDSPVYVLGTVQEDGHVGALSREGEETFLISYRSEEQFEREIKSDTFWQGWIALGLFLFGLIYLVVIAVS